MINSVEPRGIAHLSYPMKLSNAGTSEIMECLGLGTLPPYKKVVSC
jgi:hypothetical protein